MPRYEFSDEKSHKFWDIQVEGVSYTVRFGKIGTEGQSQSKSFSSAEEAQLEADKAAAAKVKKGYLPADDAAPDPRNPELEAAIHENPENQDAWAVYGDWLQSQGDPRGEAVAIGVAIARGEADDALQNRMLEILDEYYEGWLGETLYNGICGGEAIFDMEWKYGFLPRARVSCLYDFEGPSTLELLNKLLSRPVGRFLQDLTIGMAKIKGEADFSACIDAIAQAGERPGLRRLHMGDFNYEECEISWSSIGDMSGLLPLLPNLEWLQVHGGDIRFNSFQHAKLKELTLESAGLPAETCKALSQGELPALESLTVWLGTDERGGNSSIGDFNDLFSGKKFPALKHLGIQNSDFQNDIAAALISAPILAQLNSLDLSMGTMTDKGAQALLDGADALKHLEKITVDQNFISDDLVQKLQSTFKDKMNTNRQRRYGHDDDLYVSVGE